MTTRKGMTNTTPMLPSQQTTNREHCMPKPTPQLVALFAALLCPIAALAETAPDGVEIVPLYLNENGDGILRFTDTGGSTGPFTTQIPGPAFTFCVQQFRADKFPDGFGMNVWNTATQKSALRYRFVHDAAQAEAITSIGEGDAPGECSTNYAP